MFLAALACVVGACLGCRVPALRMLGFPPPVDDTPAYKKGWFWGVVVGGAAVLAGGTVAVVLANKTRVVPYTPTVTTLQPDVDARSAK